MTTTAMQGMAQAAAARLAECLVWGTLLALVAGLGVRLLPRRSARWRFAVWFSVLMVIAVQPLFAGGTWPVGPGPAGGAAARPLVTLPGSWALYLFAAWAAVAGWGLVRLAAGLWRLRALRRSCAVLDPRGLHAPLRETLEGHRGMRQVSLSTSEQVQVPTAIGLAAPAVVFPAWVMEELSPDELKQVLLHELTHLRRWDDWTNLAQQVVKALLFFHPAVWWIESKISLEREIACDEAVLAHTRQPRAYAECLARLAEKTLVRRTLAVAQAVLGRARQTSLRVARILDADRPPESKAPWKSVALLLGGLSLASALLVAKEPPLIAFQNLAPEVQPAKAASSRAATIRPIAAPVAVARRPAATLAERTPRPVLARNKTDFQAAPVMATEAVFLVVEDPATGATQPVYELQVWRLVVLHPGTHPASREFPRKES